MPSRARTYHPSTTLCPSTNISRRARRPPWTKYVKAGEAENIDVRTIVEEGAPADEIIKASKAYDLIVMGTLGRTGLSHLLMGSVAEKVVRFAHCPVMVIRTVESTEGP